MRLKDPVEILYLSFMHNWKNTAPEDGKQGLMDGEPDRNTQMSRLAFLLRKVTAGRREQEVYRLLARHTRRRDGESYVSQDRSWMQQPYELSGGWFFEGCTSLIQKQDILQALTKAGLSATFVAAADDFVAGKSVKKYFPTEDEEREILTKIREEDDVEEII